MYNRNTKIAQQIRKERAPAEQIFNDKYETQNKYKQQTQTYKKQKSVRPNVQQQLQFKNKREW